MTTVHRKCHIQTLSDAIELSLIASLCALVADIVWLLHDVASNGISVVYCIVFVGLLLGNVITSIALYRHHTGRVRTTLATMLRDKLALQHSINKHFLRSKKEHKYEKQ